MTKQYHEGADLDTLLHVGEEVESVEDLLLAAARTFRERSAVYGTNYLNVGPVMRELFPQGVPPELVTRREWHLFELIVVKLTRFVNSGLSHSDSIHDIIVYAAMIEGELAAQKNAKSEKTARGIRTPRPEKPGPPPTPDGTRDIRAPRAEEERKVRIPDLDGRATFHE